MVAARVTEKMKSGAWIRRMFTIAQKLSHEHGPDRVFDFSLGNPTIEPPPAFHEAIHAVIHSGQLGLHRYMPARGFEFVRTFLARQLTEETSLAHDPQNIVLCVGAGGGLNITLKALLDPGDEVIVLAPYFLEYESYVDNHRGVLVTVRTTSDFHLDLSAIASAITPKTKAIIVNSPNNPTGVIYTTEELEKLSALLRKNRPASAPIFLISDEPYAKIILEGHTYPAPVSIYENTIVVTSYSKSLGIPGERIGYVAIPSRCHDAHALGIAVAWSQVALGFVNAPALMQHVIPRLANVSVDVSIYRANRDLLMKLFDKLKVKYVRPRGAFYIFPKVPEGLKDEEFVMKAVEDRVIMVPGQAFGCPGYVRLSYCYATERIEKSLPVLEKVFLNR